jgi:hypothetical protein
VMHGVPLVPQSIDTTEQPGLPTATPMRQVRIREPIREDVRRRATSGRIRVIAERTGAQTDTRMSLYMARRRRGWPCPRRTLGDTPTAYDRLNRALHAARCTATHGVVATP